MSRKNTYYKKPSRRVRRRRQRLIRRLVLIVIIVLVVLGGYYAWKNIGFGGKETSDVSAYYGLSEENDMIVTVNEKRADEIGIFKDGEAYIPIHVVQTQISNRFFWDGTEKVLRYVTPDSIVSTSALDTTTYMIGKKENEMKHPIAVQDGDRICISAGFLKQFADIRYETTENPNRITVSTEWGEHTYKELSRRAALRERGGSRSDVIRNLDKGSLVTVTEEFENWVGVTTQDGLTGYLRKSDLGAEKKETFTSDREKEEFTHITMDQPVCLAWHQVTNQTANGYLTNVLEGTKGINVLSPTWFYLNDNKGGIMSYSSAEYVKTCHDRGIKVWGLVSNLENPDVDTAKVLNTTSSRDALINNLIAAAIQCGMDGINVDFEALNDKVGYSFIEFIRELSVKCENNDLVLSVDNYPPSSYTGLYFRDEQAKYADYVILMAYDEHFTGDESAGSVASLPFVTESVANSLKEVPEDQLILGIPFYTRLWKETPASGGGITLTSENIGMADAQKNISDNKAEKTWLDEEAQYYAEYEKSGSTYKIWVEDTKSITEKLNVLKENDLAGAAFWKLTYEESSIWNTINGYLKDKE